MWGLHTGWMGAQDDAGEAFEQWGYIMAENKDRQEDNKKGWEPYAPIVEFYYDEATLKDLD